MDYVSLGYLCITRISSYIMDTIKGVERKSISSPEQSRNNFIEYHRDNQGKYIHLMSPPSVNYV